MIHAHNPPPAIPIEHLVAHLLGGEDDRTYATADDDYQRDHHDRIRDREIRIGGRP